MDRIRIPKKLFIIGVILITLIVIPIILFYFFRQSNTQPTPRTPIPTPTPIDDSQSVSKQSLKPVLQRNVENLHWLNNQELAFTFFDQDARGRVLAKTDGTTESILLKNNTLKMSEIYWSDKNDLLIYDYGTPYRTYLFKNASSLQRLPISGYGFSWSPSSESFFYNDATELPEQATKIYTISTNNSQSLNTTLPSFVATYWSPANNNILLYNFNIETGKGDLNLFNLDTRATTQLPIRSILFPSWSPSGDKIAYLRSGSIFVYTLGQGEERVYQTPTDQLFMSYIWNNDNEILLFDAEKSPSQLTLVNITTKTQRTVLSHIKLSSRQRIQMSISPNNEKVAIASEKDGLWISQKLGF